MPSLKISYCPLLLLWAVIVLLPGTNLHAATSAPTPPATAPEQALPASPAGLELPPLAAADIAFEPDMDADFIYQRRGRPDPFMPFLAIWTDVDEEEELRGLRRFEPNQLRLSAVVLNQEQPLAMVQDIEGFGHIIRPGTAIGRHGRVTAITANRVTIREEITGLTGEPEHRTVEMVLKKEGED